nr:hypothetical protein 5 [Bacillaceae bacterium]
MIRVKDLELPIDVKAEIEEYDWEKPTWKGDRLIACSPFRHEKTPSFAVNFENGTWIDSGGDGEYRKGNFVKLLSLLRGETYEETEEYLISLYSPNFGELDKLELSFDDWELQEDKPIIFDRSELKPYLFKHPYLERRGIPFKVQRAFDVGYHPDTKSVVLVWHDINGNIVNWKHRNVHSKLFWYKKGGQPIRKHLYGIHWVVRKAARTVWVVESEIDALTLWSQGKAAVAIGTSYLSNEKRDLLLKAGVEKIIIATDNDKQGEKAKRSIIRKLGGRIDLEAVVWDGLPYKDINEARDEIDSLKIEDVDIFNFDE